MMFVDTKYIAMIQSRLVGFVKKANNVWNFRCPICGDSKHDKSKKRGYFHPNQKRTGIQFTCHNCISMSFYNFLEKIDPALHSEYRMELFTEKYGTAHKAAPAQTIDFSTSNTATKLQAIPKKEKTPEDIFYSICTRLDALPETHAVIQYCNARKIPKFYHQHLYLIKDTTKLKELVPDTNIPFPEERLVLPFFDTNKKLLGGTCRSLKPKGLRYLTFKLVEGNTPMIFGLDRIDPNKKIYVTEGPIDSLFLPNSIAVTGTAFNKLNTILPDLNIPPDQVVVIIDNQPRNKEVVAVVKKMIDQGFTTVIWDTPDTKGKDINAMITDHGIKPIDVFHTIKRCSFRGMEARIKFAMWKKC